MILFIELHVSRLCHICINKIRPPHIGLSNYYPIPWTPRMQACGEVGLLGSYLSIHSDILMGSDVPLKGKWCEYTSARNTEVILSYLPRQSYGSQTWRRYRSKGTEILPSDIQLYIPSE